MIPLVFVSRVNILPYHLSSLLGQISQHAHDNNVAITLCVLSIYLSPTLSKFTACNVRTDNVSTVPELIKEFKDLCHKCFKQKIKCVLPVPFTDFRPLFTF